MHCIRSRCHPLLFNAPPPPPPQVFWTLFGAVLVFFMQIGFSMLEVGSVQAKSTKNVLVKNSFDVCLSSLCWAVVGHSIAFGHSEAGWLIGGGSKHLLFSTGDPEPVDYAHWLFQWAFVSTACTIVSGAVAERIHFRVYFVFVLLLCVLVYPVIVHWTWSEDGFMSAVKEKGRSRLFGCGVIDFAGSGQSVIPSDIPSVRHSVRPSVRPSVNPRVNPPGWVGGWCWALWK